MIIHKDGDKYLIIGKIVNGKRFRISSGNPIYAMNINLWNGRVWQVRDGKRTLLKRVVN